MTFEEILDQAMAMLQRRGRLTYRTLKLQFHLDDEHLEALKDELIYGQRLAVDEDDRVLVWTGDTGTAASATSAPAATPVQGPLTYTPPYLAEKILTSRSALEGERKQVTVLFADIKDSTELIKDLDPEEAQKLLDPALHIMMDAVHRFEGTVNQVLGDGIMAIFGAPLAHEDHALRACYAALAMQTALQPHAGVVRRSYGIDMQMRVGLNSGEVVVRTIGNDLHMDYSAVGPTTHLAARMEQVARPGTIRFSGSTLRLVEGLVQVTALGPIPVKGMTVPVEVYELTGASAIRRRLQAAVARGLTTFVGRDTEITALHQALKQAEAGHGQVVAAVGEAGVGKSRLLYEFIHAHRTQGWLVLESASVSYGKATPYFPVLDLLKRYVHVEDGDDPRTIRAKVTGHIFTLDASLQETIPPVLSLLDALPEGSPFLQLDPPQRRQRTLDGLKRIVLRESQVQPLLLVFEDLHWIDSETQAFLDSLVEHVPTAPLLLLVNYRPEYHHAWGSKTCYTQLRLDPLPPERADAFLATLLGNDRSLDPLKTLLIARTEGNPFFLEESVRTLVETQVFVGEQGAYRLEQALPAIQVPATVQAVLAARIDRLPQAEKQLVQTAAVIGTEVPFVLLQAIAEIPEEALYRGLTHLQAAEFLYETSLFPERVYTFKHALTHEVAYGSLLQERRRALHARIVEALEALAGDRVAEQMERLAYNALRGEVWDKALTYCQQAGEKVMARSAYREAVGYFEQALSALPHLPETRDTQEQAIDLRSALYQVLYPLLEFGRSLEYLREAESLAEALGDQRRLGWISASMSYCLQMMGRMEHAVAVGQRAHTIAETLGDGALQFETNVHLGRTYHILGDNRRAIDVLRRNVASIEGDQSRERFGMPDLSRSVTSRAWLAVCHTALGEFAEGIALGEEAVRMAEAVDQPLSRIIASWGVGTLYLHKGDFPKAISALERGLEVCQIWNIRAYAPAIATNLGASYTLSGRVSEALPLLEQYASKGVGPQPLGSALWLSQAYLLAGRVDDAMRLAQHALELSHTRRSRVPGARTLWLLGEIAMHRDPPDVESAEAHYQQALTLSEERGLRPLQAHCHRGLGTLYAASGQRQQAQAELSAAIDLYHAMDMTFWLPQTEAALAQVGRQ